MTPKTISGLTELWHVTLQEPISEPLLQLPGEAPQLEYNGTIFAEDEYGGVPGSRTIELGGPLSPTRGP